jgi:hypothetical protein
VALPQDSEHGVTDAVETLLFLIWQLLHWLLFGCKNSQKRPRATCGNAAGPNLRFHTNRATWAAEPLLCQIR